MSDRDATAADESARVQPQVERLQTDECWRLLQDAPMARIALVDEDGDPEIYPVNIQIHDGTILIRSAEDAKVRMLRAHPRVALMADGGTLRVRWSVIVHAAAEITDDDPALHPPASDGAVSWHPGEKPRLIRLTADSVTGRRFLITAGARP
ncbi:pyridoxamine 5'-phosphate oxidase family protein [Microbacterium sp.]|uniref:pyridoxamine 5'-phosphate oxidase family protein n=1 Tax=Microbacterium sp. TaxID=51671 RepID=UPI003A94D0E3